MNLFFFLCLLRWTWNLFFFFFAELVEQMGCVLLALAPSSRFSLSSKSFSQESDVSWPRHWCKDRCTDSWTKGSNNFTVQRTWSKTVKPPMGTFSSVGKTASAAVWVVGISFKMQNKVVLKSCLCFQLAPPTKTLLQTIDCIKKMDGATVTSATVSKSGF